LRLVVSSRHLGDLDLLTHNSYLNEDEVGSALKEWLSRNTTVKRSDIFITTKVWPHLCEPEDVEWSLNNSLEMLGTDYVDCFLIHWPFVCERTEDRQVKDGPDGKVSIFNVIQSSLTVQVYHKESNH
jgi:diketogulonate reductase-like aldo/keto reductase